MGCSHNACGDPIVAKGLCKVHYGRQRRGADMDAPVHRRSRAGRHVAPSGYVSVKTEKDHRSGWDYEHRVVMEQKLGRDLLPGENVHHINGNRADNRPENLELWVTTQPAGQRPEDLVAWAREVLARYDSPA